MDDKAEFAEAYLDNGVLLSQGSSKVSVTGETSSSGDDSSSSSSDDSSDDETTITEDAKSNADTHINDNVVGVAHDCMVDNEMREKEAQNDEIHCKIIPGRKIIR